MRYHPMMGRKLHIGGHVKAHGWEILDANAGPHVDHVADARDLRRFDDDTFDEIYASHVVEHLDYKDELVTTLSGWRRVMVPGGHSVRQRPRSGCAGAPVPRTVINAPVTVHCDANDIRRPCRPLRLSSRRTERGVRQRVSRCGRIRRCEKSRDFRPIRRCEQTRDARPTDQREFGGAQSGENRIDHWGSRERRGCTNFS